MEYLLAVIFSYLTGFIIFFITGLFIYSYGKSVKDYYPDQYNTDKLCKIHNLINEDIILTIKTLLVF